MALILLIDDDDDFRVAIREALEDAGHRVFEAANGLLGLRQFHNARPDLVVLDVFMPVKDGIETMREIRAMDTRVKIIAMSGGGRFHLFVDGLEDLGASLTLYKPISCEVLLHAVDQVL